METSVSSTKIASQFLKAGVDPVYNKMLQDKAWQDIRNLVVAGAGVGAAGRGLMGLYNITRRTLRPTPTSMTPDVLTIRIPTKPEEEEEEDQKVAHDGFATDPPTTSDTEARPYAIGPPWLANIPISDEDEVDSHLNGTKMATASKPGIVSPGSAESTEEIWWYPAGSVLGAGAGLYGGWKIVDSILDYRRRTQQEEELEKAREQFRGAIRPIKEASELGVHLDALYDALQEKKAAIEKQAGAAGRFSRKLLAGYTVYGGLSSLMAGMWMYERARKRQRRVLLEAAKEKRLRQRFAQRPPRIMAIPYEEEEEETTKMPDLPKLPKPKPAALPA